MQFDRGASARIIWLAALFVVFGIGVGLIWVPASQSIDQVRGHARELYEEANQNDAIVRRANDLRAAQQRIHKDVVALGGERSAGAITAATLRLFSEEAKHLQVDVRSVAPTPQTTPSGHDDLNGTDVAIGVRGPFRNVVDFIADLPRHDVLVEIHNAQISSSDTTQQSPVLEVTLNATIYRLTGQPLEAPHARTL